MYLQKLTYHPISLYPDFGAELKAPVYNTMQYEFVYGSAI